MVGNTYRRRRTVRPTHREVSIYWRYPRRILLARVPLTLGFFGDPNEKGQAIAWEKFAEKQQVDGMRQH